MADSASRSVQAGDGWSDASQVPSPHSDSSGRAANPPSNRLFWEWATAGLANAATSALLNPIDVTKTRMQAQLLQSSADAACAPRILDVVRDIYRSNGAVGLWKPGLAASMWREVLYSGCRAGFYAPVRDTLRKYGIGDARQESVVPKVLAAFVTGTIGSLIANPVDVVKIRMMVNPTVYPSVAKGLQTLFLLEGIRGLYKGVVPSTLRGASIAIGELATYDQAKYLLEKYSPLSEGFDLFVASSLVTGLVATTVAAPFDFLKTRIMNSASTSQGIWKTAAHIVRKEGLLVLFRGWVPAYCRLGPHAIICFPLFEYLRALAGLDYL